MEVISSNAPYYMTIPAEGGGQYNIYLNAIAPNNLIYTGLARSNDIDMQPILVNYVPRYVGIPVFYGNPFSTTGSNYPIAQSFVITYNDVYGFDASTEVNMLYCTENATNEELGFDSSTSTFPMIANDFLQDKFYNGSYFSVTRLFAEDSSTQASFEIRGIQADGTEGTVYSPYTTPYAKSARYDGTLTVNPIYKQIYILSNGVRASKNIEVVNCLPANSYILYYVNSFGAVDWIICDKKNSVTYNADRHSMTKYADISDRKQFSKINYLTNTTRTWTLNTDIMDDTVSKQMYKVFYSEYMWLYDVDKDEINTVVLEDASLKIKRFDSDKIYNYTIKVKSSQTFTIQ